VQRFPDIVLHARPELTLSSLSSADAPALRRAVDDPVLRTWLPLPSPYTLEMAESWCTTVATDLRDSGRGFVLAVRSDGSLVASIDAKRVDWRARSLVREGVARNAGFTDAGRVDLAVFSRIRPDLGN